MLYDFVCDWADPWVGGGGGVVLTRFNSSYSSKYSESRTDPPPEGPMASRGVRAIISRENYSHL